MLKELVKLAEVLDKSGNISEANKVDYIIKKYAQSVPDSQSPQGAGAQTISKSEARYQLQAKEGKYFISLKTSADTFAIGSFSINEIPSVVRDVISGRRPVEGATPGDKYTVDQFIINTYGLVDGSPKLTGRERITESSITKSILGKLKELPVAPPPKVLSPAQQVIENAYVSYKRQFASCATSALNSNPSFSVITTINFTANKDGTISNQSAVSSPPSPDFDSCLLQKMNGWRFQPQSEEVKFTTREKFGK